MSGPEVTLHQSECFVRESGEPLPEAIEEMVRRKAAALAEAQFDWMIERYFGPAQPETTYGMTSKPARASLIRCDVV